MQQPVVRHCAETCLAPNLCCSQKNSREVLEAGGEDMSPKKDNQRIFHESCSLQFFKAQANSSNWFQKVPVFVISITDVVASVFLVFASEGVCV